MASKFEEEFNPWPSFVDVFSSVILVLLLFLLVVLANLGYYSQFKYKVSYTGSVSSDDLIRTPVSSVTTNPNSDVNIQIIKEQKQMVLALKNQLVAEETALKSAEGTDELESAGINVADTRASDIEIQKMLITDEYFIVTYKADELFVDDVDMTCFLYYLETNFRVNVKNDEIAQLVSVRSTIDYLQRHCA